MTAFGIFRSLVSKGQSILNPIPANGVTGQHEAQHQEVERHQPQARDSYQAPTPQLKNIESAGAQSSTAKDQAYTKAHQRLREDVNSGAVDPKKTNLLNVFARYVVEERSKGNQVSKPGQIPSTPPPSGRSPEPKSKSAGTGGTPKPAPSQPKFSEGTVEVNEPNGNYTAVETDENGEAVTFTYTPRDLGCADDWT